jgi:hypothetical protein
MKILPVGTELFLAQRQMDGQTYRKRGKRKDRQREDRKL